MARSLVLVAHSGGGVLLPAIAAAASAQVFASIYLDALLPNPGRSWLDSAPAPLAGRLVNLAVDGRLPSWDRWFPQGTIECLLPDPTARTAFLGDLPEVPLACLSEPAPAVPDPALNRGYIRLSDPYDGAAEAAMRLGWVIHREALHHLAMLTDPLPVADAILSVLARMEARNADGS